MRSFVLCLILASVMMYPLNSMSAGWKPDGISVGSEYLDQQWPYMCTDAHGGAIIVWRDERAGSGADDIYAQRIDEFGNPLWQTNGVPVCTATNYQGGPRCVPDYAGGAIIAWYDYRNATDYDIYAQRLDSDGNALWTSQGVAICTASEGQGPIEMIIDYNGGAVICWTDNRSGSGDIYAQRISQSGSVMWTINGNAYCYASYGQAHPKIVTATYPTAIIVWDDYRNNTDYNIYAQKFSINASGTPLWTANGVAVNTYSASQQYPELVSDGLGGAIVIWLDLRDAYQRIYAQRLDGSGGLLWTSTGLLLCDQMNNQSNPAMVTDGSNGAIIAWAENRSGFKFFGQRLSSMGVRQWSTYGVEIVPASAQSPSYIDMTEDGSGGAWLAWLEKRNENAGDVYAQHMDGAGTATWGTYGIGVCTFADAGAFDCTIIPDILGGAIVAWTDQRIPGDKDVYVQRLEPWFGQWGHPEPLVVKAVDVPADQGGSVALSWKPSQLDAFNYQTVTYYSVWRATDPVMAMLPERGSTPLVDPSDLDREFEGPAVRVEHTAAGDYYWEWVGNIDAYYLPGYSYVVPTRYDSTSADDAMHYFQVITHTSDRYVFWISDPDSGYSVDNLAPCPPQMLSGEQSVLPAGLQLTWAPNTESDLGCYRVYRGTAEEFVPGPGTFLATACDTTTFDDGWGWDLGYWYKVAAVDIHGNESAYAVLGPEDVTGTPTDAVPLANFLAQNYPNPFAPQTMIGFGLREAGHVSLRIYDAAGRLVRVLIDERRDAGPHEIVWNGLGSDGYRVASGVYFYTIQSRTFKETRKMVLLR